jgi:hypothetical protein
MRSSWLVTGFQGITAILLAFGCGGDDTASAPSGLQGTGGAGGSGAAVCGNAKVESGEECDQTSLNGGNCASATSNSKPIGVLRCASNCTYDISGCSASGTGATTGAGGTSSGAGGSGVGGI